MKAIIGEKLSCRLKYMLVTPSFQYVYLFRKASNSRMLFFRYFPVEGYDKML